MADILKITLTGPFPSPETHGFHLPTGPKWVELPWSKGGALPDVWCAMRRHGEVIEGELEISNASFKVGQKARPMVQVDSIKIECQGWTILTSRPPLAGSFNFPTKRPLCSRFAMWPSNLGGLVPKGTDILRGSLQLPEWRTRRRTFGPANLPLPSLTTSIAATLATNYIAKRAQLESALWSGGAFHDEDSEDGLLSKPNGPGKIGPFYPWGPNDPGAPAGSGIQFATGYQQVGSYAQYALLAHQLCMDRAWVAYDRDTGKPISVDSYPGLSPLYNPGSGDPNDDELPEFRGLANNDPLPKDWDPAHSIRGIRFAIAAWEMTGSPMCKRHIQVKAEQARLAYSERGHGHSGGYWPPNLTTDLSRMRGSTGKNVGFYGYAFGRMRGWPAWIIAEGLKTGLKSPGWSQWVSDMLEVVKLSAPKHGVCQRYSTASTSDVWFDPNYDTAHSFEVPIFYHGMHALCVQTGRPPMPEMLAACRSLYDNPAMPPQPYYGAWGPWQYLHVAKKNGAPLDPLSSGKATTPPGDGTHTEAMLALAYLATNDRRWLDRSILYNERHASVSSKKNSLSSKTGLGWQATLLAAYQKAGI